jgi:hypothetical protein
MKHVPNEKPEINDWCYETTSFGEQNRDVRIGMLKEIISDDEVVTVTIGGKEIHWRNAEFKKIPSELMRATNQ